MHKLALLTNRGLFSFNINDHDIDPHPDLNSIIVTELEVTGILQKLNVNKSCGPDDVILKRFSSYLAPSLCSLFNRSLRDGRCANRMVKNKCMPSLWARVTETVQALTDQYLFCLLLVR